MRSLSDIKINNALIFQTTSIRILIFLKFEIVSDFDTRISKLGITLAPTLPRHAWREQILVF